MERFVGAAEADHVGGHTPNPVLGEHPDHVSVEERPGRLTVLQQRHLPVGRSRVDIGHAQGAAVGVSDIGVCRLPREVGQLLKGGVLGSVDLYTSSLSGAV